MKIGIIGIGVVGYAIFAAFKPKSECEVVIYDPEKGHKDPSVLEGCDGIFVCVPTPTIDNKQDLYVIHSAFSVISKLNHFYGVVILKSTVLPGTSKMLVAQYGLRVVFNPEFLSEKTASHDFINQPSIIIGCSNFLDRNLAAQIYSIILPVDLVKTMTLEEAEMVKYVRNSFSALKISFFNEIYLLCQNLNVDYEQVRHGVKWCQPSWFSIMHTEVPGQDKNLGFGGKCLPKDLAAFISFFEQNDIYPETLLAANKVNKKWRE